jgi:hypothetical protein
MLLGVVVVVVIDNEDAFATCLSAKNSVERKNRLAVLPLEQRAQH